MADRARYVLKKLLNQNKKYPLQSGNQPKNNDICVYSKLNFCPYQIFQGTKFNFGNCPNKDHCDIPDNSSYDVLKEIEERRYLDLLVEIYMNIKLRALENQQRIDGHKVCKSDKLNEYNFKNDKEDDSNTINYKYKNDKRGDSKTIEYASIDAEILHLENQLDEY
ncbi:hypothetical protein EQH57_0110, partial [Dictyocoela roeselum]